MEYVKRSAREEIQKLIEQYRCNVHDHKEQIEFYKGILSETESIIEELENILVIMDNEED